ncbi:conserved hypothetical protein [Methanosalsum zhilinae DSM 4017]|uniref:Uncharacterized protein n=2 Tax=Methanosalsum zhilinae TaxID=39669 RepID=F7XQK7_METZD|nr:conserved hypothetical protein [Methanosalsum zhilinae DSM 4017]
MEFDDLIQKYDSAIKKYRYIYIFMDFLIISVVLYIIFYIFNINQLFAFISFLEIYAGRTYYLYDIAISFDTVASIIAVAIISLILVSVLHFRKNYLNSMDLLESRYSILKDRLKTAYDNREKTNIVVSDLIKGVSEDISGFKKSESNAASNKKEAIKPSDLLNKKRIKVTVLTLLALTSVLVYITATDTRTDFAPESIIEYGERIPFIPRINDDPSDPLPVGDDTTDETDAPELPDGERTIIVVEGKDVDLTIPPGSGMGFAREEEGEPQIFDFVPSSAHEVNVMSSPAYYEDLPEGYEGLIKAYFEEMSKE